MQQPPAVPSPPRILLVEEQPTSRDLIVLVLGKLDYHIDTVASGQEALERAGRACYALILLSATIPSQPAAELLAALRRRLANPALPVFAICPEGDQALRAACLRAGASDCLTRPLDIDRLLRLVERSTRAGHRDAAPEAAEPVLDLEHLGGFTDGDPQLESELLALFQSSAALYLERMAEALQRGEPWRPIAHALKGASANLGARRLARLARTAEHSAPSQAQIDTLRRALAEVEAFFELRRAKNRAHVAG